MTLQGTPFIRRSPREAGGIKSGLAAFIVWCAALALSSPTCDAAAAGDEAGVASGWEATIDPSGEPHSVRLPAAASRKPRSRSNDGTASPPGHPKAEGAPPISGEIVPAPNAVPSDGPPGAALQPAANHGAATSSASAPLPDEPARAEYVSAVKRFCSNIGPTAIEARVAWQKRTIAELEQEMEQRMLRLDAKIAEHKLWLTRRQEFAAKVGDGLVQLVSRMRPDAAAQQLAAMEEATAAALIMKLGPKAAGPLLNEVPPDKAARITGLIASAAEIGRRHADAGGDSQDGNR